MEIRIAKVFFVKTGLSLLVTSVCHIFNSTIVCFMFRGEANPAGESGDRESQLD